MTRSPHALALATMLACSPQPQPTPRPEEHAPAEKHEHDPRAHELEAQHHEISTELANPAADHRVRNEHRHHRFERADEWVAKFDDPERDAWQKPDAVLAALSLKPDSVIADIGAGTGYFAVRLARAAPRGRVYAIDVEPDMIRYLGERAAREGTGNLEPVLGEAADPRIPAAVDVALLVDTYHHVGDPTRFFAKVRDSLRPGGVLAIVDFKKDAAPDAPGPPAAMRIADDIVVAHLKKLGLSHLRTDTTSLPHQYIVLMTRS